ncbi:hypothetical protein NA56DRAFT_412256 [Hyaloscypha hepaticicola]|uniref:Ubiquitin-like protease family profile domain-containing protein n=1 Tax=Hyaloscypha hepaticicola TaxID=2082293 RepID=A0A2J6PIV7_9HELO|nr:hypothetical protein NA56DRAFT_412256 [Hyaloscypha hepaticicola]
MRAHIRKENEKKDVKSAVPAYPLFPTTPSPTTSSSCTGIQINLKQALQVLNPDKGTPTICTQVQLEFICGTKITQIYGTRPCMGKEHRVKNAKFFCLYQEFYKNLMGNTPQYMTKQVVRCLSRRRFWNLRYLFIPIKFTPVGQSMLHAALCAISPEAKTVDYVCSDGDTGLLNSPQSSGSECLPAIFAWLTDYLGKHRHSSLFPFDWKKRVNACRQQSCFRGDCGIYSSTYAMCLAFCYGIGVRTGSFARDHQAKFISRRRRYAQDLLNRGFAPFDPSWNAPNWQYYPLLDNKPTASKCEGFIDIPLDVIDKLPRAAANRRACYIGCRTRAKLLLHCRRNARF